MSQNKQIKAFLDGGGSLTAIGALNKFGSWRLAARIKDLRDSGMSITTVNETDNSGKTYARYFKGA